MKLLRNCLLVACAASLIAIGGLYGAVRFVDMEKVKARVSKEVMKMTGRELQIHGTIDPAFGLVPAVVLHDVSLANPQWAEQKSLLSAKELKVSLKVLPLLQGQIRLGDVSMADATVSLERSKKGTVSWKFSRPAPNVPASAAPATPKAAVVARVAAASAATQFHIEHLLITNASVNYLDHASAAKQELAIHALDISHLNQQGVEKFALDALYKKKALELTGSLADNNLLMIVGHLIGKTMNIDLDGSLDLKDSAFDVMLKAKAEKASSLMALAGVKSDIAVPLSIEAKLGGSQNVITVASASAESQQWKGKGAGTINLSGAVPYIDAQLMLDKVQVMQVDAATAKTATADQPSAGTNAPLHVDGLKAVNGNATIKIGELDYKGTKAKDVRASITMQDGVLKLSDGAAAIANGQVMADAQLDSAAKPHRYAFNVLMDNVPMETLWPLFAKDQALTGGAIKAALKLQGSGTTQREMLASAQGDADLFIDKSSYNLTGTAKQAESFIELLRGRKDTDGQLGIQCAVGQFDIAGGKATSKVLAFKTSGAVADGSGTITLPDATMDIVMRARSGGIGLADIVPALRFKGPIANPSVMPDAGGMLLGIGKMVLGATTGVGLVAVLGEKAADQMGITSDNNPCLTAIAKQTAKTPPATSSDVVKQTQQQGKDALKAVRDTAKQAEDDIKGLLGR